jgi:hypothetical protein
MWNEYGDTNLHIVFGDTQNDSWESLNGTGWRTKFEPDLTYWLSIKSELGSKYGEFGDGYVPYNVIIGPGYQVYLTGAGFDEAGSRAAINAAIANFQFYPINIIPDKRFLINTTNIIDLSGVFYNQTGQAVVYSIVNNSDPLVLDASVTGSSLSITTKALIDTSELTVKGTAGTRTAYFKFNIETYNSDITEIFYEDFDSSWPPEGWTLQTSGAGWVQSSFTANSSEYSAFHDGNAGSQDDWIYTPKVKITGKSVLSFWQRGYFSSLYYDLHGVGTSRDLIRYSWLYPYLPSSENWEQVFIDLSYYNGQEIYIGFNYQGDDSDLWFIDDVRVYTTTGIEDQNEPVGIELNQNYPNPFNPATELSFSLDTEKTVRLAVYNSKGESVAEIFKGNLAAGVHKYNFDAGKLNSGIYFYALEFEGNSLVNKMLLLK